MAPEEYNSADLTSILRTLSALSNQSNPAPIQSVSLNSQQKNRLNDDDDGDSYEPSELPPQYSVAGSSQKPTATPTTTSIPSTSTSTSTSTPQARTATAPTPNTNPTTNRGIPDSSSITTWPNALRHVMRTVSQNDDMQQRIRRLIQSQHDHEKQWWAGREAIVKKQKARIEKKKELDEVLRSVGAPVDATKQVSTVEEDQAELKHYDAKVYKSSTKMAEAMNAELRALKIPFFSIKHSLISNREEEVGSKRPVSSDTQTISRDALSVLQLRMLELLQDLCKE